jgi:SAM-dependent methyltransferase
MLANIFSPLIARSPAIKRAVWLRWYQFLARGYRQENWTFMNYGYAEPAGSGAPLSLLPHDEADRCSIQLYHRVVGGVDLRGRDVLEVGSGRGGGCSYVARYLRPRAVLGIDYSEQAVTLSRTRHAAVEGLEFAPGDAEALPCENASFDAILNVESSHCYGSMDRFLSEVARVLRPGGHFLWADMRHPDQREIVRSQFHRAGLEIIAETNIAPNVVLALDHVQDSKRATIHRYVPGFLRRYFEDFAGIPGTRVYESLRRGDVEYWCFAARRSAEAEK